MKGIKMDHLPPHPHQTMSILAGNPLFWIPLVYIFLINTITLAQSDFVFNRCDNTQNYTVNSTYQTNLYATLSTLPTTNSGLGFFNFSLGEGNNTVNSIALCRGDVGIEACNTCLSDSIVNLRNLCPNQKEAIISYDICLLQYSNNALLVYPQLKDYLLQFNPEIATDINEFNAVLRPLMGQLIGIAATGGPLLKFAYGNGTVPVYTRIYAFVHCSPYLTEQQCSECLEDEVSRIGLHDNGKIGGKIVLPDCNFRFEVYQFLNQSNVPTTREKEKYDMDCNNNSGDNHRCHSNCVTLCLHEIEKEE
ncbi:antimicrobial ginkbilobin-2-like protein [Bidens hawaiensis]|uniref:antimicrobial ginkbilobin-2-like protein n=1 Tax=Bidens hawaiensis TaxID=980011 RepID=UPI00404AA316